MSAACVQMAQGKRHVLEAGETMAGIQGAIARTLRNVESISLALGEQRNTSTAVASMVEQVAQSVAEPPPRKRRSALRGTTCAISRPT